MSLKMLDQRHRIASYSDEIDIEYERKVEEEEDGGDKGASTTTERDDSTTAALKKQKREDEGRSEEEKWSSSSSPLQIISSIDVRRSRSIISQDGIEYGMVSS